MGANLDGCGGVDDMHRPLIIAAVLLLSSCGGFCHLDGVDVGEIERLGVVDVWERMEWVCVPRDEITDFRACRGHDDAEACTAWIGSAPSVAAPFGAPGRAFVVDDAGDELQALVDHEAHHWRAMMSGLGRCDDHGEECW